MNKCNWSKIDQFVRELNVAWLLDLIHSDIHRLIHRFCGQVDVKK